jgi:hypothetical protein
LAFVLNSDIRVHALTTPSAKWIVDPQTVRRPPVEPAPGRRKIHDDLNKHTYEVQLK